jgi:hypothetical protein
MEDEHDPPDLLRQRAEIARKLDAAQLRVRQLIIDINAIDASIRLFVPDVDLPEIRSKPLPHRHATSQGEIMRAIHDALVGAGTALTTHDLTLRVMAWRSLNASDLQRVRTMQKRVGAAMRKMRELGWVKPEAMEDEKVGWRLLTWRAS